MQLQVFAVYDKAVQAYLPPFYVRSKGEALRSFTEAVNDPKNPFNKHAADFTLVLMGEFDDASGMFSTSDPTRMISAVECLAEDPFTEENRAPDRPAGRRLPM